MPVERTHNQAKKSITQAMRAGHPLMMWGSTGIGKSVLVQDAASDLAEEQDRELKMWHLLSDSEREELIKSQEARDEAVVLIDHRLASFEPTDIKGLPDLSGDYTEWKTDKWLYFICQDGAEAVLFFDEINKGNQNTLAAFYRLFNQRATSNGAMSDGVRIIAAGNRAEDQAAVTQIPAPLRDRFVRQLTLRSPTGGENGSWTKWAIENDLHDYVVQPIASPMLSDKLDTFVDAQDKNRKVFATARSWERLSEALYAAEEGGGDLSPRDVEYVAQEIVGEGVAAEIRGFLDLREEVDLQEILENPEKVKELDDRENAVDLKHSVLTGIAGEYDSETDLLENLVEIAQYLDKEFGVLLLRLAKNYHPRHFGQNIKEIEAFDDLSMDFVKYLDLNR